MQGDVDAAIDAVSVLCLPEGDPALPPQTPSPELLTVPHTEGTTQKGEEGANAAHGGWFGTAVTAGHGKTTTTVVWKAKYFNGEIKLSQSREIMPFCRPRCNLPKAGMRLSTEITVLPGACLLIFEIKMFYTIFPAGTTDASPTSNPSPAATSGMPGAAGRSPMPPATDGPSLEKSTLPEMPPWLQTSTPGEGMAPGSSLGTTPLPTAPTDHAAGRATCLGKDNLPTGLGSSGKGSFTFSMHFFFFLLSKPLFSEGLPQHPHLS